MASIRKIEGKTGTSYKITVTKGVDASGKQLRYFKTWTPARQMTARQMEKEVQRVALEFEQEIELGYQADNRQTFQKYAEYFIELREREGAAPNTIQEYHFLLERVAPALGYMRIKDIRPGHLNKFYAELSKEGTRRGKTYARRRVDIVELIKARGLTYEQIARDCGGCPATISRACRGARVRLEAAESISRALGGDVTDFFSIETDTSKLSPTTVRAHHTFIQTVLRLAEKEMIIPYNPADKASPPQKDTKEAEHFTAEEISRILECLSGEPIKWQMIVHLLIITGCRRGEIAGLKWSKIDFDKGRILIDSSLSYLPSKGIYEGPTKTRATRWVSVPRETLDMLRRYRAWQIEQRFMYGDQWIESDYVFTRHNGGVVGPDNITAWLSAFAKRHGLRHAHPHMFRHSAATLLISSGVDVTTVSKRLGHANAATTMNVYSHLTSEAERESSERIADITLRKKRA